MQGRNLSGRGEAGGLVSSTATYRGSTVSRSLSGEVHLVIEDGGLLAETTFESSYLAYDRIRSIAHLDYEIVIRTEEDETVINHLGSAGEWFFKELCESFNQKVQTVLQAKGPVLFEAKGPRYEYEGRQGNACFRVFEDAVMLLPPNMDARRLPLVFLSRLESKDFTLTLHLSTGEQYSFSKLGENLEPFERIISDAFRKMRSHHGDLIAGLDHSLGRGEVIEAAKIIPEGVAVFLSDVQSRFPSLAKVLDQMLLASPIAEYYAALKEVGDEGKLAIGYKEFRGALEAKTGEDLPEEGGVVAEEEKPLPEEESEPDALPWALWAVIPSKDHKKAIVEFAFPKEKAATYLFNTEGSYESFLMTLNRAFEASGFQREMLFLTDEQLGQAAHVNGRMLLERTPSLQALRRLFSGRVIHRSLDSWKKNLVEQLG